jgi:AraC family transcriptional regulator
MDWLSSMQNSINYMEDNILNEIDYDKIAQCAYSSTFHFQRMFSMLTGFTIGEYIRNRRLTLAAQELSFSNVRVTDIAFKYGYETSEAFTKAFQRLQGVTPSAARESGVKLKSFSRLSIQITMKGDKEMNYRIEEKQAFEVFGISTEINDIGDKPYIEIPEYWKKCILDGTIDRIHNDARISKETTVHSTLYNRREGVFSYMICYHVPVRDIPDDYERLSVPALTWAIFTTGVCPDGECDIQSIWKLIWTEWFPTSSYEQAIGPEFEMTYFRGNNTYEQEVWIPVIKR